VGYAACHWCHVMAHESFEDPATAAYLNEHFVSVKVDREERPDVDAVYMQATVAMTGQGGWPMTVVLDHDGKPFFAGTYFPDQPRHGMPAFTQVLQALSNAWTERRDEVDRSAESIAEHLRREPALAGTAPIDAEVLAAAVRKLAADADPVNAGFGGAPKFPPSMVLEFLRRHHARTGDPTAGEMVTRTTRAMAAGGIYDQLGGGFARYSVDAGWVVPHFEKMLYDNALLLGLYARLGEDRVTRETADFLLSELRTPEGGFASALDADSDGAEGTFYVWTPDQLRSALGDEDGAWAAELLSVTEAGTFEHGASTLQLLRAPDDAARWAEVRQRLLAARAERTRPARDDKVVAAWNGLAVSGLVAAGLALDEPRYLAAARSAGSLLRDLHVVDGRRLRRVSRDGVVGSPEGVLEDYGCVAGAFLDLFLATGEHEWLVPARGLLNEAMAMFGAPDGGFFDTCESAEQLVARPRDPSDNASPSGLSSIVHPLLTWAALTGSGRHRDRAEQALASVRPLAEQAPRFAGWSLAAAEAALAGPVEVAVVGHPGPERDALAAEARRSHSPGLVVVVGEPDAGPVDPDRRDVVSLLQGRGLVDGHAAAYVCRNLVCRRPVTDPAELRSELGTQPGDSRES
ncbi:MAG TPA: thioredoxin domain-containing protein, partial [Marmoricola sp.]|nr:thioredoxin domain-containing protein [Marmoricola sp.]